MGIRLWTAKQSAAADRRRARPHVRATGTSSLTPTPEMDEHYRREYRYDGEIFSHGYPRDDVLVSPDADRIREETRDRLGIGRGRRRCSTRRPGVTTWPPNYRSAQMAKHLDVESAAARSATTS